MGGLFAWLIAFLVLVGLLGLVVFQLMCIADLEYDYINPYDFVSRINAVILPEFVTQGFLCLFYLVTGHWFMSLLCAPYLFYNLRLYTRGRHLADVTEVFNVIQSEKKRHLLKLGYLVLLLFLSMFWMVWSAIDEDDYSHT